MGSRQEWRGSLSRLPPPGAIRSTRRDTCHLACTRAAVDARCHVSAASLAVSETAGAEACIKGSMISDLGGLARWIFNALLAPPGRGSLLRLPRHSGRLPTKEISTVLGIVLSLECERYLPYRDSVTRNPSRGSFLRPAEGPCITFSVHGALSAGAVTPLLSLHLGR